MAIRTINAKSTAQRLTRTLPVLMRVIRRGIQQTDPHLSMPHFRILQYLQTHPGSSLSELSAQLAVTNATASSHVEKLVQRQLVNRIEDRHERRRVVLTLTDAGAAVVAAAMVVATNDFAQMLRPLSTEELLMVEDSLDLLERLAARAQTTSNAAEVH
jgi:DNA-binding MarR family transcriptional regulator